MNVRLDPIDGTERTGAPSRDAEFAARVMAGIAREARPTPARSFTAAVRRGAPSDAAASIVTAWRLATLRRPVALGARVRALALALGVTGALATSGGLALASVAGIAAQVADRITGSAVDAPEHPRPREVVGASPSASPAPVAAPGRLHLVVDDHDSDVLGRGRRHAAADTTPPADPTPTPQPARHDKDSGGDGHDGSASGDGTASGDGNGSGDGAGSGSDGGQAAPTPRPTHDPGDGSGGQGGGSDGSGGSGGSDGGNATPDPTQSAPNAAPPGD
jgi:hypothetical protein